MTAGTLRFSFIETSGFFPWLIKFRSFGRFTHVDLVLPDGRLLGALNEGVVVRYSTERVKSYLDVEVPVPNPEAGIAWAKSQIGKPYDWGAIFGFGLAVDFLNAEKKWFCSELVVRILFEAGMPKLLDSKPHRISPVALLQMLSWAGGKIVAMNRFA